MFLQKHMCVETHMCNSFDLCAMHSKIRGIHLTFFLIKTHVQYVWLLLHMFTKTHMSNGYVNWMPHISTCDVFIVAFIKKSHVLHICFYKKYAPFIWHVNCFYKNICALRVTCAHMFMKTNLCYMFDLCAMHLNTCARQLSTDFGKTCVQCIWLMFIKTYVQYIWLLHICLYTNMCAMHWACVPRIRHTMAPKQPNTWMHA